MTGLLITNTKFYLIFILSTLEVGVYRWHDAPALYFHLVTISQLLPLCDTEVTRVH